ncbi:MAG TPA: peptidase MA family metallohydrolase [Verrucomicrobiae bacterium]|jgi:Peptidase MA superfamily/Tetratricopeptide repeat|nr:peptidase MA family metallohydrolase [Verrucomicrobiae bacterium]
MRLSVTLVFSLLALSAASADTIHLKNGRTILADHVRENGNHYDYDVGDDSYAIPKSLVDHVDSGGMPGQSAAPSARIADLPSPPPVSSLANEGAMFAQIIKEGRVDPDVLITLEKQGNTEQNATANFIAGKFEFDHGNIPQSRDYFENALRFQPNNSTILTYYAALLVRTGNATQALSYAQRAVQSDPNSADAYTMLGYVQFASDHTKEAVASWQRSLALRPDPAVQQFLAKAQREQSAESNFSEHESSHFVLHYEGKQTSEAFRSQILTALESDYDDLARDLGNPPRDNITVTLYTEQAFFDVTQAPTWSGAINDGKLRIPISGLTSMTPELAHVLKHELAHSFITQLSAGRCPPWLHEGIAQFLEPKSLGSNGRQLAVLFKSQQNIPLNALEGSFMSFSGAQAYVAYAESLAAVTYINDTYGMSDIQRILERLSEGNSTEAALRSVIHEDYGQFETDLAKYLADKYGD